VQAKEMETRKPMHPSRGTGMQCERAGSLQKAVALELLSPSFGAARNWVEWTLFLSRSGFCFHGLQ